MLTLLSPSMKGSLKEIIDQVHELSWNHDLYVTSGELTLVAEVAVIEDDGESDTFEGLHYYLSIQDIQSIAKNLEAQTNSPKPSQILEAVKYYHANDAFLQV